MGFKNWLTYTTEYKIYVDGKYINSISISKSIEENKDASYSYDKMIEMAEPYSNQKHDYSTAIFRAKKAINFTRKIQNITGMWDTV